MKKKRINDGIRGNHKAFINESEIEENIKSEISKEITFKKRK